MPALSPARRGWSRRALAGAAILAVVAGLVPAGTASAAPGTNYAVDDPFSAPRTAWWREARFGMFIHFGAYSWWGGEYRRPDGTLCRDAEWIKLRCSIPWSEYGAAARRFNPSAEELPAPVTDLTAARVRQRKILNGLINEYAQAA